MSAQSALLHHVGQQTLHARVRTCCAFQVAHHSKRFTCQRTLRRRDVVCCSKRSVKAAAEPAGNVRCYPCVLWKNLLALSAGTTFKLCHTANTKGDKQGAASDTKEEKRGAAAEADVGGNFIPVIKPEDLPKGISRLVCLSMD